MSREFEVIREVDLPAAPDDVWTAITEETAAWQFPTGEPPSGAGGPHHDVGAAAPARDPHGVAGRHLQCPRLRDRGPRRRHRPPALRPHRDPLRRVGGPVRRDRQPHRLLPPHPRAVPRALQGPQGHLRRPAVGRHQRPRRRRRAGRDGHAARRPRPRPGRGRRRHGPRVTRRRRHARRRRRLLDAGVPRRPRRRRPVPLLRAQPLPGRRRRDERARVRRRARRRGERGGAQGVAGRRLRGSKAGAPAATNVISTSRIGDRDDIVVPRSDECHLDLRMGGRGDIRRVSRRFAPDSYPAAVDVRWSCAGRGSSATRRP